MPRSNAATAVAAPAAPAGPAAVSPDAAGTAAGGKEVPGSAGNSNSSAATNAAAAVAAAAAAAVPTTTATATTPSLGRKLFVGGTGEVDDDVFRAHFSPFGEIEDCVVLRKEGVSRGFGFVTFSDEAAVERALAVTVRFFFCLSFSAFFLFSAGKGERSKKTHARITTKKRKKNPKKSDNSTCSTASRSS